MASAKLVRSSCPLGENFKASPGRTRYFRLETLLKGGGTSVLRELLEHIIAPANLATILNRSDVYDELEKLRRRRVLKDDQWELLFPPAPGCVQSTFFDITLLVILLRQDIICNLTPPSTGWDNLPNITDVSLAADIARIKFYRNNIIAHINEKMTLRNEEFDDYWTQVKESLLRIVGFYAPSGSSTVNEYENAIDDLLTGPLVTTEDSGSGSKSDVQEKPTGVFTLRCVLKLARYGAWLGGTLYALNWINSNLGDFDNIFPGISVESIDFGSIVVQLRAEGLDAMDELRRRYDTGELRAELERFMVTEELKSLADGESIEFTVEIDEEEYITARQYLDMKTTKEEETAEGTPSKAKEEKEEEMTVQQETAESTPSKAKEEKEEMTVQLETAKDSKSKSIKLTSRANQDFKNDDKVSEVITDSSSDIMDTIALELDSASRPLHDCIVSVVPHNKYSLYDVGHNPAYSLVHKKRISLEKFMENRGDMKREDVFEIHWTSVPIIELKNNINALRDISQCLDRVFRCIQYWSHLAYVLEVNSQVIRQCELYSEDSPTIKLFKFLKATRPRLSVKELKNSLLAIKRVDIYGMINKNFKDDEKVSEVITDSSCEIMDTIALELDSASRLLGNYEKLAQELGVPHNTYRKFEMYSDYNPAYSLVRYLYTTSEKPIPLEQFMGYLRDMKREDVIDEVEKCTGKCTCIKNLCDVLTLDSDLLQRIADLLNKNLQGVEGWRGLGIRFKVESAILDSLEPPNDKNKHSPTTRVIEWLAAAKPSTTINDIVKALEKIMRNDAIKILKFHFDFGTDHVDRGRTTSIHTAPYGIEATEQSSSNALDPDHVDRGRTTAIQTTPYGIQATEQSSTNIFQGYVRNFGIPSKTIDLIGRDEEKTKLITDLTRGQHQMVVLSAASGFGKTTLVVNVAHGIMEDPYCYTVVYVDSKIVFSLNDLAYKILSACGINSFQKCPRSQVIELFDHSNTNCLLILENLDQMYYSMDTMDTKSTSRTGADEFSWQKSTTSKKEEFQRFLKDITESAPNLKVLVTTCKAVEFVSIKVKQMTLNPLDEEKFFELLRSRSDLPLDDQEPLEPIFKCCGGIPLLLCAAVVFLSNMGSVEDSCEWFASSLPGEKLKTLCPDSLPEEERFNYCLEKCFERINVCSKQVLVIVSVFPNAFTLKEAEHMSTGIIEFEEFKEGFQSLWKFSFLDTYDSATKSYTLHPAIRSFGFLKAREDKLKPVFEKARRRFLSHTFDNLFEIEEEFFSTQCKSAIQKYRLQDESIREIARWCISEPNMDNKIKTLCIDSFLESQYILLKLMRSNPLKLILCKFAQLCRNDNNTKLYCECLIMGGAKIIIGCLCAPHICPTALKQASWCFGEVIKALNADQSGSSQDTMKIPVEKIDNIFLSANISVQAKAQFLIKYGKCLVRHGLEELGFDFIRKGIEERMISYNNSPSAKSRVMLAMSYEDLAGAYTYTRQQTKAISIREKYVLPVYRKELGIHPFAATAQSQLARNYLELGDHDNANNANNTALKYRTALLGDHQDTARSLFDKGAILREQAQVEPVQFPKIYEEALSCFKQALEMQKRVLDSPEEKAKTHQELAFVLTQLGRREEAEQQMNMITECIKKMEKMHEDLPTVPKSRSLTEDVDDSTLAPPNQVDESPARCSPSITTKKAKQSLSAYLKKYIKKKFGLNSEEGTDTSTEEDKEKVDTFFRNFALEYQHHVCVADLVETLQYERSVGAIVAENVSGVKKCAGTCFRIGKEYVITNKHVVDDINQLGIPVSKCHVDFNYQEQQQAGYCFSFVLPDPVLVWSEDLDYAILKLQSEGIKQLPDSVTESGFNIAPAGRQLKGGDCLSFIGHPGGLRKQIDVSCPIKQVDIQEHFVFAHNSTAVYNVSTFFEGSSGSPGFLIQEKLLTVIHSRGFPFPGTSKQHVLECGILMSSIVNDVMRKINVGEIRGLTLDDIFGGSTSSVFDPLAMEINEV